MTVRVDRRTMLRLMGVQLALPLLSTVLPAPARAQAAGRSRFIGVFFPNGANMPGGTNGNWNFNEALQPLVAGGFQNNTMIVRGLHNGFGGVDPHWQNTAGFLSCQPVVLGDSAVAARVPCPGLGAGGSRSKPRRSPRPAEARAPPPVTAQPAARQRPIPSRNSENGPPGR